MATGTNISTYFDGAWHDGDIPVIKGADHGAWLGSNVFDGARFVNGLAPDLDKHCARVNRSAEALMLVPTVTTRDMVEIVREGLAAYADARPGATFTADATVWDLPCDAAFPCATENELDGGDAKALIAHGVTLVAEGANMPCTPGAVDAFREAGVAYGPGKAANAGGVATSGLEMRQNARFETWTEDRTDEGLRDVMAHVHAACTEAAQRIGRPGDLAAGANVAGFERVAGAMHDQGVV